jgi:hypothetical protein
MRIELEALRRTVRRLEVLTETKAIFNDDEREAQRIAEQLGFKVDIVILRVKRDNAGSQARRCIARELRTRKKWSLSRIGRAMHLQGGERSVRRLLK